MRIPRSWLGLGGPTDSPTKERYRVVYATGECAQQEKRQAGTRGGIRSCGYRATGNVRAIDFDRDILRRRARGLYFILFFSPVRRTDLFSFGPVGLGCLLLRVTYLPCTWNTIPSGWPLFATRVRRVGRATRNRSEQTESWARGYRVRPNRADVTRSFDLVSILSRSRLEINSKNKQYGNYIHTRERLLSYTHCFPLCVRWLLSRWACIDIKVGQLLGRVRASTAFSYEYCLRVCLWPSNVMAVFVCWARAAWPTWPVHTRCR